MLATLFLYVKTSAKENKISGWKDFSGKEYLVLTTTSPARENKANKFIITYISKILGIKKNSVSIKIGKKSQYKVIAIQGLEENYCRDIIHKYIKVC